MLSGRGKSGRTERNDSQQGSGQERMRLLKSRRTTRRGDGGQAKSRLLTEDLLLPCVLHSKTLHSLTLIILCGHSALWRHPFPLLAKAQSWEPLKDGVSPHLPLKSSRPASREQEAMFLSQICIPPKHGRVTEELT